MDKEKVSKLIDICEIALVILKSKEVYSLILDYGEEISIDEALKFTDSVYQDTLLEL